MARKDVAMTGDELLEFLDDAHTLHLATIGPDGYPHLAPMWYVVRNGDVWFRSFSKSQKIVNLTRDPRIAVMVESGLSYSELMGVMIKGRAELVTDRSIVLDLYRDLATRYPMVNDEILTDVSDEQLEALFGRAADKNTGVRVVPERIVSWDYHKIGGGY